MLFKVPWTARLSYEGEPLPAVVDAGEGFGWTVLADTIWFTSGDDWERRTIQLRRLPSGSEDFQDLPSDGCVTRVDNSIVLDFICADTGSCVAPDRLVPVDDGLGLSQTYLHAGATLFFERIE